MCTTAIAYQIKGRGGGEVGECYIIIRGGGFQNCYIMLYEGGRGC